ncbi:hypothetical protein K435DRAFT_612740, partial [Dendrothele bispora CBS 962.96]
EKYPFSVMRWGLCATADAVHDCHIDAEGFATACSVLSGEKYWLVALPPDMDFGGFASAATYLESYNEHMQNDQGWVIVALKLTPGTTLIMRPNTPHLVVTLAPSICFGSHFYCSSTLRDTCFGIYHCFVQRDFITNHTHPESRRLLFYILVSIHKAMEIDEEYLRLCKTKQHIPHLPNLGSFKGLNDLLCVINLIDLGSAIFAERY